MAQDSTHRRTYLKTVGLALSAGALAGVASGQSVQDPYSERWIGADSSNFTDSSRSAADIRWIVLHVTEGSYDGAISWFQDPAADVSAHYVIRNSDGHTTQMVDHSDVGWHAGGQNYNSYSIGIEHEGYTDSTQFSTSLYERSAAIVRYLCEQYSIPKHHPGGVAPCDARDSGGIIGHHQVPESDCGYNDHTDPGSTWDWDYFMELVGGTNDGGGGDDGSYSWPLYSNGDRGEAVYTIQYLLEEYGYDLQYHDGIYGSETTSTVETFQDDSGLAVDGIVGPNTWSELVVNVFGPDQDPYWATYAAQHNLRYGHGYSIAVDGLYGPETENAITSFQSDAGITVDGLVGPQTWRALVDRL